MPATDDLQIIAFKTQVDFEQWLSSNCLKSPGIWLKFHKVNSGLPTIKYNEAVEAALCYGWIDGQKQSFDESSYLLRFTPRRPRSIWSKVNTQRAEKLLEAGKITVHGLKEIEKAKSDGRWEAAYASASTITEPDYWLRILKVNPKAKAAYEALNKTNRYAILFRLHTAKKEETRMKRVKQFIEMLNKDEKFQL